MTAIAKTVTSSWSIVDKAIGGDAGELGRRVVQAMAEGRRFVACTDERSIVFSLRTDGILAIEEA